MTDVQRRDGAVGTGARLVALCFDANDPVRLATFWADALRWEVDESAGEIALRPTDGTTFGICFRAVPGQKSGPNRLHLDLTSTSFEDQAESVESLIERGARHLDVGQRPDEGQVVLSDPEGNEFCIIEPDNAFLAGCGRLGAVNGDGSREVGYFWSEALGWPLVWDQDEETAVRAPDGTGPMLTWGGPPVARKLGKNRLHLDIAPLDRDGQRRVVDHLTARRANRVDIGQGDVDWVVMTDPDGNEFCVRSSG